MSSDFPSVNSHDTMKYVNILDETGTLGGRINPQGNCKQMVGTGN